MGTARIATLNLFGRQGVWEERRSVLLDGLRELRPDVVAFQDVVKVGGYDQAADLLGPGYHVAHQTDRAADGSGVSIASRWPLGEVQELDLRLTPRTSNLPYGVLVAEILASD
jgi:exonuclease III